MVTPARASILVVEDDEGIGSGLVRALGTEGHQALWCRTAADAFTVGLSEIDLVILDLGLPDGDGLDLCRHFRAGHPALPILILTARDTETDIVVGLDAGADDYLTKPFRLAELQARIRALLRHQLTAEPLAPISIGGVTVDPAARRVWVSGTEVELRAKEFDLLLLLLRHAGAVVTREDAMNQVWDEHWFGSTKTLDVTLASLRRRLGDDGPGKSRITTLRGVGFRFERPDTAR